MKSKMARHESFSIQLVLRVRFTLFSFFTGGYNVFSLSFVSLLSQSRKWCSRERGVCSLRRFKWGETGGGSFEIFFFFFPGTLFFKVDLVPNYLSNYPPSCPNSHPPCWWLRNLPIVLAYFQSTPLFPCRSEFVSCYCHRLLVSL